MTGSIPATISLGLGTWGSLNLTTTIGLGFGAEITGGGVCATVTFVPSVEAAVQMIPSVDVTDIQLQNC